MNAEEIFQFLREKEGYSPFKVDVAASYLNACVPAAERNGCKYYDNESLVGCRDATGSTLMIGFIYIPIQGFSIGSGLKTVVVGMRTPSETSIEENDIAGGYIFGIPLKEFSKQIKGGKTAVEIFDALPHSGPTRPTGIVFKKNPPVLDGVSS